MEQKNENTIRKMTIEEYRSAKRVEHPRNGAGFEMPQLIDDIWEAREALIMARKVLKSRERFLSSEDFYCANAVGYLNRALGLLDIKI